MISKSGQTLSSASLDFAADANALPAQALRMTLDAMAQESPEHAHRKGQLVIVLHGAVTTRAPAAWWVVPPQSGVWIPGGVRHANHATPNAQLCFLFVEPGVAALPDQCCTLAINPMLREMILWLADHPGGYAPDSHEEQVALTLTQELSRAPVQSFHLPISENQKLQKMAEMLTDRPDDRGTLTDWAIRLAVSERTLNRLIQRETGLSFGRWRQQFHIMVALRELAAGRSVQQVAGMLGYESVTAFITMFCKALGQSPHRYFASLNLAA
ncbi:AraC family transcriptional regulator [Escherichia coli]|nr:AraC family transcriptional regulator [Escherichia coli]EFG8199891.1 AraC family transcriptional regulator [Escherichia coli]MIL09709.1 AraC family transcriptional regulator [Salmonella enterica subsp. enterica serovar Enteritidis]